MFGFEGYLKEREKKDMAELKWKYVMDKDGALWSARSNATSIVNNDAIISEFWRIRLLKDGTFSVYMTTRLRETCENEGLILKTIKTPMRVTLQDAQGYCQQRENTLVQRNKERVAETTAPKTIGDYYKMYCDGEHFSDDEVNEAYNMFAKMSDDTKSLGKPFHLFEKEVGRVLDYLNMTKCYRETK